MVKCRIYKSFIAVSTVLFCVMSLSGCTLHFDQAPNLEKMTKSVPPKIERYSGEMSRAISNVYTARKELALTFNGMGDRESMEQLLDELDAHHIKATFFLPGERVAEEPDIAKEILARGHEIENNTLNQVNVENLSYEQIYKEIQLTNEVIKEKTGVAPKYVRTKSGEYNDDLRLIAAQLGMEGVVKYNIHPQDREIKKAAAMGSFVEKYISRGAIISLHEDINPDMISVISSIAKDADEIGYKLVTLDELVKNGGVRKPLEQIPGYDAAKLNPDYKNANYKLIFDVPTDKKEIALTFDDYGSDRTITEILDTLKEYDVKATFFLRANGVERNPNLARAMVEDGHEVANHTYSHRIITTLTPEELQNEVVKAHQVITEAIQQQPTMLFRPPTGENDDPTSKVVAATGYGTIAIFDVDPRDWDSNVSSDEITKTIMDQVHPGSVILLHMLDGKHTTEALPGVIKGLKEQGYTFRKLADMIGLKQ